MDSLPALWIVFVAFLLAGGVKGIAGVGLPMTALGVLTFFTDPRTAFACALVPIFLSNIVQLVRAGAVAGAFKRYLPFLICMSVGILVVLSLTVAASETFLLGVLGTVILIFVALNLSSFALSVPDRHDRTAQIVAGSAAGILGGLTSIWLPAIVVFLTARGASKDEFIRATGLMLFVGSIPLFAGYIWAGFLTGPIAQLSVALVIPTTIGMLAGEKLRARLSEQAFRKAVIYMFLIIGLNMLRRSIWG